MKRYAFSALMVVMVGMYGCAKEEVVKKDEPLNQQTVAQKPTQTQQSSASTKQSTADQQAGAAKASQNAALSTVYFDFDKSDLRQDTRDTLGKDAEVMLKVLAANKVKIEGHCDERGSDEYNIALGDRRAKSVKKYLVSLGVAADRLSTISYGKEKPAVQGHDEAAWSKNRRADFVVQ